MDSRKKNKKRGIWLPILADLFLVGLILCTFAMFHHVIPRIRAKQSQAAHLAAAATALVLYISRRREQAGGAR